MPNRKKLYARCRYPLLTARSVTHRLPLPSARSPDRRREDEPEARHGCEYAADDRKRQERRTEPTRPLGAALLHPVRPPTKRISSPPKMNHTANDRSGCERTEFRIPARAMSASGPANLNTPATQ